MGLSRIPVGSGVGAKRGGVGGRDLPGFGVRKLISWLIGGLLLPVWCLTVGIGRKGVLHQLGELRASFSQQSFPALGLDQRLDV